MNRRTLLHSAGVLATVGLAGCLGDLQNPFDGVGVQRPVPIELVSEADRAYNVRLEAIERGTNRGTYDAAYTVTPGERVGPPHLDTTDQRFRVIRYGNDDADDLVAESAISENSQLVLIRFDDDELELEVIEDEAEAEEEREELDEGDDDETEASGDETDDEDSGFD